MISLKPEVVVTSGNAQSVYHVDNAITVKMDFGSGHLNSSSLILENAAVYPTLPTPTHESYIFIGWFTEKEGGTQINAGDNLISQTNHILYAHYSGANWYDDCSANPNRLNCKILADNTVANGKYKGNVENELMFKLAAPSDGSQKGLWLENRTGKTEGGKPVYFFRGTVTNNKVTYAGKKWRIVRIDEDGGIRLILGGNSTTDGFASLGGSQISTTFSKNGLDSDIRYVGYMYGNTCTDDVTCNANQNNSLLKDKLEQWYDVNIGNNVNYSSKVNNQSIYCNDRKIAIYRAYSDDPGVIFEPYDRNYNPQFLCTQENDKFTGTNANNIGNQALGTKPIGFLTHDEITYSGGEVYTGARNTYLYQNTQNNNWWTGSPDTFFGEAEMYDNNVSYAQKVRPVITLKPDTIVTGGSSASSYVVD